MNKILIILSVLLIFSNFASGEVIFQDNFDSQADWTRTQSTTQLATCHSGCDVPNGWDAYYDGYSRCNGGPGHNNMYLESTNAKGNSGKAMTYWDESCTNTFEDSDGNLGVILDQVYDEIYIRFYIKFQSNYQWMTTAQAEAAGHGYTAQHKLWHVQYYCQDGGTPYAYFGARDRCNYPLGVGGLYYWTLGSGFNFYQLFACEESTCCDGSPSFSAGTGCTDYVSFGLFSEMYQDGNILDGDWHCIEQHYKMNTNNGSTFYADGVYELWLDGNLVIQRTDIPWSNDGSDVSPRRGWNFVSLGGNNNNRWIMNCSGTDCEQWYAIDDVVISTAYIGCRPLPPQNLKIQ